KGMRIVASGTLRVRRWERDERSGLSVDVTADGLGIDLRWGKVTGFERTVGPRRRENDEDTSTSGDNWLPEPAEDATAGEGSAADAVVDAAEKKSEEKTEEGALSPF